MLSSIDEAVEEDLDRSDSTVQRLNIVDTRKRTLPEFIGGHGPWQYRHWLVFFLASICNSLHLFSTYPLSARSDCACSNVSEILSTGKNLINSITNCTISNCTNETIRLHSIRSNIPCQNSSEKLLNIDKEDVHCSNKNLVIYAKYIYLLGIMLSALTTHLLVFKFGRRAVAFVSAVLLFGFSIGTGKSASLANLLMFRFIISTTAMNVYLVSIFSLVECVGEEYRMLYALTGHLGWGLAHFILPLVVWLTYDWMQYSAVIGCISLPLVILSIFIPESVEACVSRGLKARSQKLIRIAAWKNGFSTDDIEHFIQALGHKDKQEEMKEAWKKGNIKRAFEITLLFLVGFSASFLYFTSMGLTDWQDTDRGGYFALAGTTEIAAIIVLLLLTCFLSPKLIWSASTVMASVSYLLMYAKSNYEYVHLSTGAYLLTMYFTSTSWTIVLLSTLFQNRTTTSLKWNTFISGIAICFGISVATLSDLQKFHSWSAKYFVIYAIPNLTIGASIAILPERYFKF